MVQQSKSNENHNDVNVASANGESQRSAVSILLICWMFPFIASFIFMSSNKSDLFSWLNVALWMTDWMEFYVIAPVFGRSLQLYEIPQSMPHLGDKTLAYQLLRFAYQTTESSVQNYTNDQIQQQQQDLLPYNVYNCPLDPPLNYPLDWNLSIVLRDWPIHQLSPPFDLKVTNKYWSICIFDYLTDRDKIIAYRKMELPFMVQNDVNVMATVQRWNQPRYLNHLLHLHHAGGEKILHRTEVSNTSFYLYWTHPELARQRRQRQRYSAASTQQQQQQQQQNSNVLPMDWKAPTEMMKMTYGEWLSRTNNDNNHSITRDNISTTDDSFYNHQRRHYYFQLAACGNTTKCEPSRAEYLFDEMPFFQPRKDNPYLQNVLQQKGIHCRFATKGTTIANHFDGSRNTIVMLKGSRRYILAHPTQCPNMGLYHKDHPSARHAPLSSSNNKARVHQVVLQAGQVLFLPTHYFHQITTLQEGINIQCNTRSGISKQHAETMRQCGF